MSIGGLSSNSGTSGVPIVSSSFFPSIAKFKAKGIPVVTPHFTSFTQEESGLTAVVGADVVQYAKAAADAIGDKLAGKGTVAVTVGSFNQTENLVANAIDKRQRKGCDWIVANDVSPATGVMGGDRNTVHLLSFNVLGQIPVGHVVPFATVGLGDPRVIAVEAVAFGLFGLASFACALSVLRRQE